MKYATAHVPKVGLALGGGGARGCAHVGVIKALEEAGIQIHCVAGTSIGALVGGVYAVGNLPRLEAYLLKIKWKDVMAQFDPVAMQNGMFGGKKVVKLLDSLLDNKTFRSLEVPYTAVATDLVTGKEVHLNKGKLSEAIRASICLPGIFTSVKKGGQHLLDGGLVNPMPVNVVRKMGADIVIAVDLNHEFLKEKQAKKHRGKTNKWDISKIMKPQYPNMVDVLEGSVFLMQDQITQQHLEAHPADILLNLNLSSATLFDFHKAKALIDQGYEATQKHLPKIRKRLHSEGCLMGGSSTF